MSANCVETVVSALVLWTWHAPFCLNVSKKPFIITACPRCSSTAYHRGLKYNHITPILRQLH